ncbi:hypothetical protein, partial [Nonomuraea antri]|uniref:hypothetical protein n=1 Tax=Nonomuraea antri TaxID=2730852 RepID=UPI0038B29426
MALVVRRLARRLRPVSAADLERLTLRLRQALSVSEPDDALAAVLEVVREGLSADGVAVVVPGNRVVAVPGTRVTAAPRPQAVAVPSPQVVTVPGAQAVAGPRAQAVAGPSAQAVAAPGVRVGV